MFVLLPPSAGKTMPDGPPVALADLVFAERLTKPRDRLLRALRLTAAPAGPAAEVYTGVLYRQLGLADLPHDRVLIASALFGVVSPGDRVCAYTLDMGSRVPRLRESLTAFWRPHLAKALPDEPGLLLDLRSGSYAAAWRPRHATVLGVRAFTQDGKAITHMVKSVRGDVARIALQGGAQTPEDVADLVRAAGFTVELTPTSLDVIANP